MVECTWKFISTEVLRVLSIDNQKAQTYILLISLLSRSNQKNFK